MEPTDPGLPRAEQKKRLTITLEDLESPPARESSVSAEPTMPPPSPQPLAPQPLPHAPPIQPIAPTSQMYPAERPSAPAYGASPPYGGQPTHGSGGYPAGDTRFAAVAARTRAGFWERFAASALDALIGVVAYFILAALLGVVGVLFACVGIITYIVMLEGGPTGQTLGKRALGIRVVDHYSGSTIGHGRAFGRYLSKIISGIPFYLGYLWMIWDPQKQAWHDKMIGSVVVKAEN